VIIQTTCDRALLLQSGKKAPHHAPSIKNRLLWQSLMVRVFPGCLESSFRLPVIPSCQNHIQTADGISLYDNIPSIRIKPVDSLT